MKKIVYGAWAECYKCGSQGPVCETKADATKDWNTRYDETIKQDKNRLIKVRIRPEAGRGITQKLSDITDLKLPDNRPIVTLRERFKRAREI